MKKVFEIASPFQIPDGTLVAPFLNSKDCMSGLPFALLNGFSLAAGIIGPKQSSKIHIMRFVTQVTFVRHGNLQVRMKGPEDDDFYSVSVETEQAVLTEPSTFFQLVNETDRTCEVLYIVSPAYLFDMTDDKVIYDDSLVLDEDWGELKRARWHPAVALPTAEQRRATERRLAQRSVRIHATDRL